MIEQGILKRLHETLDDPEQHAQVQELMQHFISLRESGLGDTEREPFFRVFTADARERLAERGFEIYDLVGKSLFQMRAGGEAFFSDWFHADKFPFDLERSICGEVAIEPKNFCLPRSGDKDFDEQVEFLESISANGDIPVEIVMGDAVDYAGVLFAHNRRFGEQLVADKYIRTKTVSSPGQHVTVGMNGETGLNLGHEMDITKYPGLVVAPLVIPALRRKF